MGPKYDPDVVAYMAQANRLVHYIQIVATVDSQNTLRLGWDG